MDPNIDKYVQQPTISTQQPAKPLMQTEQVPNSGEPLQQAQHLQPEQQAQQPAQPKNFTVSQSSQSEHQGGIKSFLKVLLVLIIIIGATAGVVYAGYVFLGSNKALTSTQNANVFVEPSLPPATPTPSVYQSNPNDTSDSAIDKDSQILNQDLSKLDSAITGVDDSLSDKQTNLQ